MTRARKIAVGLASVAPIPLLIVTLPVAILTIGDNDRLAPLMFIPHLVLYSSAGIVGLYLIVDIFTNRNIRPDRRLIWIVVLLLGNVFAFPVYWYFYIWRDGPAVPPAVQKTYCRWCGYEYDYPAEECVNCGRSMEGGTFVCTLNYERVGAFLPFRNRDALWGYYLGVFSFLPAAGLLLGPAAVALGFRGLRSFREGPDRKGRGHAYAAVVLGTLGFAFNVAVCCAFYLYLYPYLY